MPLNPRDIHALDQFGGLMREVAKLLANYRKELEAGGMAPAEAWALTQRLEERLMEPAFQEARERLRAADAPACPQCGSSEHVNSVQVSERSSLHTCMLCLKIFTGE